MSIRCLECGAPIQCSDHPSALIVVDSPESEEMLRREEADPEFHKMMAEGLADADAGRVIPLEQFEREMEARIAARRGAASCAK